MAATETAERGGLCWGAGEAEGGDGHAAALVGLSVGGCRGDGTGIVGNAVVGWGAAKEFGEPLTGCEGCSAGCWGGWRGRRRVLVGHGDVIIWMTCCI